MILTEQQQMVREAAAEFARGSLAPHSSEWAEQKAVPQAVLREMGELGFMGMTVAEEWGGAGLDYVSYALALIEIAAGDGAVSTIMSVNNAPVCAILQSLGNSEQKENFLKPLARGEIIGAFGLSEPQAGSDAANLLTRARKSGDRYCLNGTKQFITSGKIAGVVIVFAVTDPGAGKRGISAFLVPADSEGLIVSGIEEKMGQEASDTAQLTLEDVMLGSELRIGDEGDGYKIALANLETGRIGIAAQSVGMARAALEHARAYAMERRAFGKRIFDHQAVAFRLADMATELEAAQSLTLQAAAIKEAGQPCLKQACMAKLFASEAAERICSGAVQILGGYGYTRDYPVEKIYRDVRVCQIYEGTSDVQKLIISRQLDL
ncbi:MAG: acyl-CoA dehydrogenase family protein [Chromatiales bacterium]|nr:acyl-CoA dehydrogenase family protein [Chromatiales bacterium]MDH3893338.1 acyl-CoA dehydrogenase family protein [Chromatiales bacterium]MDH4013413.1 acyl-CoA dehydrogenase family protein [Chromatiales bacterium]PLX56817.1 MAG: acyl-CoA dehydrogenase [Chromatiales bacterium]